MLVAVASLIFISLTFDEGLGLKYNSIAHYYSAHRRRCIEKSLEARESRADAVFTGTIRDLIVDRRHPHTKASLNSAMLCRNVCFRL